MDKTKNHTSRCKCPYCRACTWLASKRKPLVVAASLSGTSAAYFTMPPSAAGPLALVVVGIGTIVMMKAP